MPKKITRQTPHSIFFPNEIMNDNFTNKRMHIIIYKSESISTLEKQLKDTIKKDIKKMENAISGFSLNSLEAKIKTAESIAQDIRDFKGKKQYIITLPIPNELTDEQSHDFSAETGMVKDLTDKVGSVMGKYFSIQKVVGQISANLSTPRVLANPGYFQNYTGSKPRDFSFTFSMIPNSAEEAETIMKIIKLLKKYSSPTLTADSIMRAPHFFHFFFSNHTLQNLTGIRPCVISSISTNYAGSGILETTMDGMPKQIDLSVRICELRTITNEDWMV